MTLPVLKSNSPGADSIVVADLPSGLTWYAGYVGGRWPDYSLLAKRFGGKAYLKSIAVNASEDADVLDVEAGDAVNTDAPGWFWAQKKRGADKPCLYTSASNVPALITVMANAGVTRGEYLIWEAHFDGVDQVTPGYDAKQWIDHGPSGENYDQDVCNPSFFGAPSPPHHNKPDYDAFQKGPFPSEWGDLNERTEVMLYDVYRQRPIRYYRKLRKLRKILQFLADRIAYEALYTSPGKKRKKPNWRTARRGYRFQQIIHRAQGQRFV